MLPGNILTLRRKPSLVLLMPRSACQAEKVGGNSRVRANPARGFLRFTIVALVSVMMVRPIEPARSQSSERPSITVAATITATAQSQVSLSIFVEPASSVPRNAFLRIRGLPPTVALSEGHSIGPGSWAISLQALPKLQIMVPAGTQERSAFVVTLMALDGTELDQKRATLVVHDPTKPDRQSRMLPPPIENLLRASPPQVGTPANRPHDREWALKLLKEGDRHLALGNIAAARQVYEMAAEAGLAQAAMALAATYDGAELARLNVRGVEANAKEALHWYELARQLGAAEADQRLRRLGAN